MTTATTFPIRLLPDECFGSPEDGGELLYPARCERCAPLPRRNEALAPGAEWVARLPVRRRMWAWAEDMWSLMQCTRGVPCMSGRGKLGEWTYTEDRVSSVLGCHVYNL